MSEIPRGYTFREAITTSDTVDAPHVIEAVYVGGNGNFVAVGMDGETVTFTGALAGHTYPVRARRINSTSTTATNLVALHNNIRTVEALGAGQSIGL